MWPSAVTHPSNIKLLILLTKKKIINKKIKIITQSYVDHPNVVHEPVMYLL